MIIEANASQDEYIYCESNYGSLIRHDIKLKSYCNDGVKVNPIDICKAPNSINISSCEAFGFGDSFFNAQQKILAEEKRLIEERKNVEERIAKEKNEEEKLKTAALKCQSFGFKESDKAYPQCIMTTMIENEKIEQEKLTNQIRLAEMELRIAILESQNDTAKQEEERIRKAQFELQEKIEHEKWLNRVLLESQAEQKQKRNNNFWLNLAASDPVQPGESLMQLMADVLATGQPSKKQSLNYSQTNCRMVYNQLICETYE